MGEPLGFHLIHVTSGNRKGFSVSRNLSYEVTDTEFIKRMMGPLIGDKVEELH